MESSAEQPDLTCPKDLKEYLAFWFNGVYTLYRDYQRLRPHLDAPRRGSMVPLFPSGYDR